MSTLKRSAKQNLQSPLHVQKVFWILAASISVVCSLPNFTLAQSAKKERLYLQKVVPLLKQYCTDCHSGDEADADLNLTAFKSAKLVVEQRPDWIKIMQRIQFGDMPPEDGEELPDDERKKFLQHLDELINQVDCVNEATPGNVTIRRLNKAEYKHTIKDLLGVDYKPADDFPGDDVGYGFDNIGDVLSLPPILMEKYLTAAEKISFEAIPEFSVRTKTYKGADFRGKVGSNDGQSTWIASQGDVSRDFTVPEDGKYLITATVYGERAGREKPRMNVKIDGKEERAVTVSAVEKRPGEVNLRVQLKAGKHKLSYGFLNDFYDPKEKNPARRDRNIVLVKVKIAGPMTPKQKAVNDPYNFVYVRPSKEVTPADASYKVLMRLASRAWRRPASRKEVTRLQKLVKYAMENGENFDGAIRVAMQAILVSPNFLFKVETPPKGNETRTISEYELGTSLSYFLWSSMPDAELLRLSIREELRKDDNLSKQIKRMIKDKKSERFVESFGLQWLQLRPLESMEMDTKRFPQYSDRLKRSMITETELLIKDVVQNDHSVFRLLDADYTFVDQRLSDFYGLDKSIGIVPEKVSLAGSGRRGILSHASILTVTSNPTRTSPVKRGKWILENILGTPPPPPAPDVMPLEEQELKGNLRERMEQHRSNPACASCHQQMDGMGFALENFDAIGRWRDEDEGQKIDASGELPGGTKFTGAVELQNILLTSKRDSFTRCFAEKTLNICPWSRSKLL